MFARSYLLRSRGMYKEEEEEEEEEEELSLSPWLTCVCTWFNCERAKMYWYGKRGEEEKKKKKSHRGENRFSAARVCLPPTTDGISSSPFCQDALTDWLTDGRTDWLTGSMTNICRHIHFITELERERREGRVQFCPVCQSEFYHSSR